MHWLGIGTIWLLASTLAWACMLGLQLARHTHGLPGAAVTSAYLLELCLRFSIAASLPVILLHFARLQLRRWNVHPQLWTRLLVAAAVAVPAFDQAAFLTSGDRIAESPHYYAARVGLLCGIIAAFVALWEWHIRGLTRQGTPGRMLSRLPRWSRYCVWTLAGVTATIVLGNLLHYHLRAYAHLAQMLLWPTWLVLATLCYRISRDIKVPTWLATGVLMALCGHIAAAHAYEPNGLSRARHEVLRRDKTAADADLLLHVGDPATATFDLSHPERFTCEPMAAAATENTLPTPERLRKNVILISIDALRRDAVDWQHKGKPLMPNLRAFSEKSVDYRRAVTTYPATLLALGGALTGGGASDILFSPRPADNVFERTRDHFERAFVNLPSSPWFRMSVVERLLLQGASTTRIGGAQAQTTAFIRKLRRARRRSERTIAWIHYFEPHAPYTPHRGHEMGADARGLYRGELSFLDKQLGRLTRFLERDGWFRDSLVIVFSDHGQALGERQYFGHHVYLNSWITDIPLMVRAPKLNPRVSNEPADITDIAPTILDFANVSYAAGEFAGLSLFADATQRRGRLSFAEAFPLRGRRLFQAATLPIGSVQMLRRRVRAFQTGARNYLPKVSVVSSSHRLIVNRVTGVQELYDRRADPMELNDLSHENLGVQQKLSGALQRWTEAQAQRLYCAVVKPVAKPAARPGSMKPTPPKPTGSKKLRKPTRPLAPPAQKRILPAVEKGRAP